MNMKIKRAFVGDYGPEVGMYLKLVFMGEEDAPYEFPLIETNKTSLEKYGPAHFSNHDEAIEAAIENYYYNMVYLLGDSLPDFHGKDEARVEDYVVTTILFAINELWN